MLQVNGKNIRLWSMLGQRGTICGIALPEIMAENDKCFVLTADLGHTSGLDRVMDQYEDRFINVGIAEQNLIGVAAGVAFDGNVAVATTFATFLTMRCFEQVRHNLGYQKANVKLLGAMSGFAIGMFGNTHYSYEDIALMRSIPNMIVLAPADAAEAYKAFYESMRIEGPVYIRLADGVNSDVVHKEDFEYEIGKSMCVQEGSDAIVFACGGMVSECIKASNILDNNGISITIINMYSIKPIDKEVLIKYASENLIFTVEEHSVIGGLGGAIAEFYATLEKSPRQIFIGVDDNFSDPGEQAYVKQINRLDASSIASRIYEEIINGK